TAAAALLGGKRQSGSSREFSRQAQSVEQAGNVLDLSDEDGNIKRISKRLDEDPRDRVQRPRESLNLERLNSSGPKRGAKRLSTKRRRRPERQGGFKRSADKANNGGSLSSRRVSNSGARLSVDKGGSRRSSPHQVEWSSDVPDRV
uniref:Btz domain-containing protein n=1 Tax=Macrostomum lignano TaxID=282301 RepID=A0A1I8FN43_9PLAT